MGIFNSIKKSRRESSDIDEKIEYLNKELEKTGLREAMTTSKCYVSQYTEPNSAYTNFTAGVLNGYGLGFSGILSNYGGEDGSIGGAGHHDGGGGGGISGAALSPPHPTTGVRTIAKTYWGLVSGFADLIPGFQKTPQHRTFGSVLWYFDDNQWKYLEWSFHHNTYCSWATNFLGFPYQTPATAAGSPLPTVLRNQLSNLGIDSIDPDEVYKPINVLTRTNDLDDVDFLPINIDGLSTQGYNYLKDKAKTTSSSGVNYDLSNWINKTYGGAASNWYENNPSLPHGSNPHIPAVEAPYVPLASADSSSEFASAPSDAFEPETVEVELTPDDIPDEFKLDSSDKSVDESKPTEEGKKVKLTKWMSRTDYMSKYPNTSMVDYLSSLPYGPSDFMTPNPNFPNAWDQNFKGYENYFMNGDLSALGNREGTPKPRHSAATPEPEEKKWGGKTKDEILAELDADISKYTAAEKAAHQEMRSIALELGMDFVSLIGGLFTGGTTAAPVLGKLGVKLLKKYGKTVAGKMIRKLVKRFRNKKNSKQLDDIIDSIEKGGNESGSVDVPDDGIGPRPVPPKPKKKIPDDMEYNWNPTGGNDGRGQWEVRDIPSTPKSTTPKPNIPPKPKKKLPDGFNYRWDPNEKGGKGQWVVRQETYKANGALLTEEAKLGHFEPEQLNVDIEDLRKGIMPEFPKDPPPEMVNGYNSKSRLAPKKLKGSSFIKITKKDLAKNHRLKDSEIKSFMDDINAVNDFIKKHPEELIYAQTRYPKDDPRLAQLNWQMDQMLGAGKEYMDKHYPENQKLFKKVQKSIKKNIELTDPKSFKGVKVPKFKGVDLTDFKRRKEVVARHYKKTVKIKSLFGRKKT